MRAASITVGLSSGSARANSVVRQRGPWPLARAPHRRRYSLEPGYVRVSAELEAELRAAIEEGDRNPPRALTADELRRLAETGEWPDS
jgi:hypothetical protein